jgi:hypothetical protein
MGLRHVFLCSVLALPVVACGGGSASIGTAPPAEDTTSSMSESSSGGQSSQNAQGVRSNSNGSSSDGSSEGQGNSSHHHGSSSGSSESGSSSHSHSSSSTSGTGTGSGSSTSSSAGGADVVAASFPGTNGTEVSGLSPNLANLPGATWHTDYVNAGGSDFEAFIDTGSGNPAPALHLYDVGSSSGSVALSLESAGSYDKPAQLTIQIDMMTLNPSTVLMVGFYAAAPATGESSLTGFTGLAVHTNNGSIDLVEDGVTKTNVPISDSSYSGGAWNTLEYTVDTTTGKISDVTLAGRSFSFSSAAFTTSATSYLALGTEAGGPSGACSYFDNLSVK